MVSCCVQVSWSLYMCILRKNSRDRSGKSASELPVPTAIMPCPWALSLNWAKKEGSPSGTAVHVCYPFLFLLLIFLKTHSTCFIHF